MQIFTSIVKAIGVSNQGLSTQGTGTLNRAGCIVEPYVTVIITLMCVMLIVYVFVLGITKYMAASSQPTCSNFFFSLSALKSWTRQQNVKHLPNFLPYKIVFVGFKPKLILWSRERKRKGSQYWKPHRPWVCCYQAMGWLKREGV
jgi:hypothetical protein